ncbi:Tetratricopeptide repeat protein 36 [Mizuhopecten yessoensis]|uniref:Tetratricopeptide repeat protein 36 n=1 Tax=Mizuhopecten yessoensis TaxID=6573 RepID=A0A210PG23_MIZYE|nr:Tetratricopeptide repeat protein 36 [Mizuhopecten yessoensis]
MQSTISRPYSLESWKEESWEEVETDEVKEAKQYEADGVTAAEAGDLELALSKFGLAIQVCPTRGSGYNNRAQALRLKGDVQGALQDLHTAIELSEGQGSAACQAFTQRGLIFKLEGEEEKALEDFKRAGALGGQFAKQQVVAMNPYAALCNQMLSEVMRKVKTGETFYLNVERSITKTGLPTKVFP